MKRVLIVLISALMVIGTIPVKSQFSEATISFEKLNHNFGTIKEEDGTVEYTFKFKNNGNQPLLINTVRSSCGCTVAEWSKEPIPPGSEGSIKVGYNPLRRPGAFRKSITVVSNARENSTLNLYIVGLVEPKPKTIADEYPIEIGSIRLATNNLSVFRIKNTERISTSVNIMNDSDHDVKVTIENVPDHLAFSIQPETLQPKQKGVIKVIFDATRVNDWGFVNSWLYLTLNGSRFTGNRIAVGGTIEEDFSHLSAGEKANAAHIVFKELTYNFGTIKEGEIIKHEFQFKNQGKETLLIRKIKTTCGCTASTPSSYEIAPGKEGTLSVTFNSTRKVGKQLQTITVITNDPKKSTHLLRIAGTVETKNK